MLVAIVYNRVTTTIVRITCPIVDCWYYIFDLYSSEIPCTPFYDRARIVPPSHSPDYSNCCSKALRDRHGLAISGNGVMLCAEWEPGIPPDSAALQIMKDPVSKFPTLPTVQAEEEQILRKLLLAYRLVGHARSHTGSRNC